MRLERQGLLMGREIIGFNIDMVPLLQVRLAKNDRLIVQMLVDYLQEYQLNKTNKYM